MKRFLKSFRYGEKGFTLIELLIVVAILGILAAVIVPNLAGFIGTGKVAAANTEVANVETAALAYYADHDGKWPADANTLATAPNDYLSALPVENYTFDPYGKVVPDSTVGWGTDTTIVWDTTVGEHKWKKA